MEFSVMEKFNNLPVVELNSAELSSFVGGDGQQKEHVKITSGSGCGGSTTATATVKVGR